MLGHIERMCQQHSKQLEQIGRTCKSITVKIKFNDYRVIDKSGQLDVSCRCPECLYAKSVSLFERFSIKEVKVRLVGVAVKELVTDEKLDCRGCERCKAEQGKKENKTLEKIWAY